MTFNEESRRVSYEMGNVDLLELGKNLSNSSMSFLPEAYARRVDILSKWHLSQAK